MALLRAANDDKEPYKTGKKCLICPLGMEAGPLTNDLWLMMIHLSKPVIFHSYLTEPNENLSHFWKSLHNLGPLHQWKSCPYQIGRDFDNHQNNLHTESIWINVGKTLETMALTCLLKMSCSKSFPRFCIFSSHWAASDLMLATFSHMFFTAITKPDETWLIGWYRAILLAWDSEATSQKLYWYHGPLHNSFVDVDKTARHCK